MILVCFKNYRKLRKEINAEKLFQWFYNNFLKANPEKCHFLTILEKTSISIKHLLGIHITAKLSSDNYVKILCRKSSGKLNALSKVAH